MNTTTDKTVRELALENPAATRVFETLGIDYCCGGNQTLEQACRKGALSMDQVTDALAEADRVAVPGPNTSDWQTAPLADLIAHIQATHHRYTHAEIARLAPLFDKVCFVHGGNHPELFQVRKVFSGLAHELTSHLMKEEVILFPHVVRMEEAILEKAPVLPPPFGTVQNPVAMMMREHDGAGDALRKMRQATQGYAAPADACVSFQTLYKALAQFEADLHQHIHLENNILFPRAIAMEA